jgi:branched-chain amino acid transport system substrate-binding protein
MANIKVRRFTTGGTALLLSLGLVTAGTSIITAGATTKRVPGVTSRQITIGATVPATGIASPGYSDVSKAAHAVFKYVNSKGGVNGRKIKYVLKDDCYGTPGFGCTGVPNTATQTRALLAQPVFATVGSLGTPTQDTVRSLLKSNGVPQLFVNSGARDWNNPGVYPGLFGWQSSYNEEGKIFAKYITDTYPTANVCFWVKMMTSVRTASRDCWPVAYRSPIPSSTVLERSSSLLVHPLVRTWPSSRLTSARW